MFGGVALWVLEVRLLGASDAPPQLPPWVVCRVGLSQLSPWAVLGEETPIAAVWDCRGSDIR